MKAILLAAGAAIALSAGAAQAQSAPSDGSLQPVKALTLVASSIPSSDLDRSIAFYTKGLGLTVGGRVEMGSVTEVPLLLPGGSAYMMLQHPKAAGAPLPVRGMLNRILIASPDLKALVARLAAAGYPLKGKLNENLQYKVAITQIEDPDGNHIELVQKLP